MRSGYIHIANNIFPTLLAISQEEQSMGLMYQPFPPPIMSFVYAKPQINMMWMKNTISPLDIVFCHNGKVSEVAYGEPNSTRIIGNHLFSDLVVELPHGMAESVPIKIGQSAGLITPELKELRAMLVRHDF